REKRRRNEMGRAPCCDKANVKKGPWSPEEDAKLKKFIGQYGTGGNWIALPQKAGLKRCGKSCRLRWLNYLRPNIKHGEFSDDEDRIICSLYASIGSRWSIIAAQLPGRTDNDIKNYWNTKLKKKLMRFMLNNSNPTTQHRKLAPSLFQPSLLSPTSHVSSASLPTLPSSYSADPCSSYYTPNLLGSNINYDYHVETLWNNYPVKEGLLMFGGTEAASCSSNSDNGSCIQISPISYGNKEIKQEECIGLHHQQGYTTSIGFQEDSQSFMLNYSSTPLQYDHLEEIKQVISSSTINIGCDNNSYLCNDANKMDERSTMYYY
ncbi:hypothetical protein RJ639_004309, partial [Escallonia herrerae]